MSVAAPPLPAFDPKLVAPFIRSVRTLFANMLKREVAIGRPYLKQTQTSTHDVSCSIGFTGELTGSVVLSFQRVAAEEMANAFTSLKLSMGTDDFNDAVGELGNMVTGAAKSDLGHEAKISVPTVIVGTGLTVGRLSGIPCIVIPCSIGNSEFTIEVSIRSNKV